MIELCSKVAQVWEAIQSEAASATANETLHKPRGAAVTGGLLSSSV